MGTIVPACFQQHFLSDYDLTVLANIYMVYLSLRGLSFVVMVINVAFLVFCGIYAVLRYNSGKVHMDSVKQMV